MKREGSYRFSREALQALGGAENGRDIQPDSQWRAHGRPEYTWKLLAVCLTTVDISEWYSVFTRKMDFQSAMETFAEAWAAANNVKTEVPSDLSQVSVFLNLFLRKNLRNFVWSRFNQNIVFQLKSTSRNILFAIKII